MLIGGTGNVFFTRAAYVICVLAVFVGKVYISLVSEGAGVLGEDARTPRVDSKRWPKACAAAPVSDGLLESRG